MRKLSSSEEDGKLPHLSTLLLGSARNGQTVGIIFLCKKAGKWDQLFETN